MYLEIYFSHSVPFKVIERINEYDAASECELGNFEGRLAVKVVPVEDDDIDGFVSAIADSINIYGDYPEHEIAVFRGRGRQCVSSR